MHGTLGARQVLRSWVEGCDKGDTNFSRALPSCLDMMDTTAGVVDRMSAEVAALDGSAGGLEDS